MHEKGIIRVKKRERERELLEWKMIGNILKIPLKGQFQATILMSLNVKLGREA